MNASALVITFTVTIATTFATAVAAAIADATAFLAPPYPPFRVVRVFRG